MKHNKILKITCTVVVASLRDSFHSGVWRKRREHASVDTQRETHTGRQMAGLSGGQVVEPVANGVYAGVSWEIMVVRLFRDPRDQER